MTVLAAISTYLDRHRVSYSVIPHPIAYTAQEEAAATHVRGRAWAKAVVCMADERPILAVLPADCMVDFERLGRAAKARAVRLAEEPEFAGLYPDCEVGAMPPLGPLYGQRVFVDTRLAQDPEVIFNAGSHQDAVRMSYRDFEIVAKPVVADFGTGPGLATGRGSTMVVDPFCGAQIDKARAAGMSNYHGQTYYFCCGSCQMEFDDNPEPYVRDQR